MEDDGRGEPELSGAERSGADCRLSRGARGFTSSRTLLS